MASSGPIFREEAIESHLRGTDREGRTLRLEIWWLRWSFWLLLAMVVAGLVLVAVTPAGGSSTGPAVIDSRTGRFAALFPVAVAPELRVATGLDAILPGGSRRSLKLGSMRVRLASAALASQAGLRPPNQPSILLTGRLPSVPAGSAGPVHASAVLTLPGRPLAAVLGQELKAMLGQGAIGG